MELRRWAGWVCAIGLVVALIVVPALAQRTRPTPPAPVPADDQTPPPAGTPRGENFSAKPPAQLFASDCTGAGCHKGPQGLGKNAGAFGLTNFLRQHYTNSQQSAAALAAYLAGIPGDARPAATKRGPEPKSRVSAEPPDGTPRPAAEKKTPPATATKQLQRRQATAEPPPAPAPEVPAAPPPPPPPKVFDIFD